MNTSNANNYLLNHHNRGLNQTDNLMEEELQAIQIQNDQNGDNKHEMEIEKALNEGQAGSLEESEFNTFS